MKLTERFIKYIEFNTESINGGKEIPSSIGQCIFAQYLVDELKCIGLERVEFSNGVIYAYKRSDYLTQYKSIGLVAHIDTYPLNGRGDVEPFVIEDYYGAGALDQINKEYPSRIIEMLNGGFLHHKLVFSKKRTTLGGDDKAGVAEIVTAMEHIIKNKIHTTDVYLAFVCDEEVGRGSKLIDYNKFNPDYTIVLDGEFAGEVHVSDMSVFSCGIKVKGDYSFLGRAKDIMKNAIDIINEFMSDFGSDEKPRTSEEKEGFYHFGKVQGDSNNVILMCTIMGFEESDINEKIKKIYDGCKKINKKYGERTISVVFPKGGYNKFSNNMDERIVLLVENAMKKNDLDCNRIAFRGLTDSTVLRENGKTAITIGIGCSSFHSIYEWASINDMEKTTNTIVTLCSQKIIA